MGTYSVEKSFVLVVDQTVFKRCAFNDRGNMRIMDVTNVREQMVFDLKIQPADAPAEPAALS